MPPSARFCHRIRIIFVKENADQSSVELLEPEKITLEGKNLIIGHTMMVTIIDAKMIHTQHQQ